MAIRSNGCTEGVKIRIVSPKRKESKFTLRHQDTIQIGTLIHPAAVFWQWIEVVVRDQIRFEILLPEANALHFVIGIVINVYVSSQVIHWQAIILIDPHFLLVRIAHRQIRNILFASNVRTWWKSDTTENSCTEWSLASLCEIVFTRNGTTYGDRIFAEEEIIPPLFLVRELNPRANGAEVILDHCQTLPIPDDIVMAWNKVETDVILLTEIKQIWVNTAREGKKLSYHPSTVRRAIIILESLCSRHT